MKVKEAMERLNDLKMLANNIRLLKQYFLNDSTEHLEEIANTVGMNNTVNNTLRDACDEISTMASKYEMAIQEAEIGKLNIT